MTDARYVAGATVEATGLSKWFGQKVAVSEMSCSFGPGVTGLLGPNGAGKTTLLRLLVGLLRPSEGAVTLLGIDPRAEADIYRRVAFVAEDEAVYPFQTAAEFVTFNATLSGVDDPPLAARKAIAQVGLTDVAGRKLATFSKGMRQRAKVAAALVHDPTVLFLDEPLNGTDPVQRAHLIDIFTTLGDGGYTVIVSSHVLHEVERMSDRVIAMVDGRLAAAGSVADLRAAMTDIPRRIRIETDKPRELGSALMTRAWTEGVSLAGNRIHASILDPAGFGLELPALCTELDARLLAVDPEDESLESVFRYLVER
jgi:ABC-2 type transport system ATP-binding protein